MYKQKLTNFIKLDLLYLYLLIWTSKNKKMITKSIQFISRNNDKFISKQISNY